MINPLITNILLLLTLTHLTPVTTADEIIPIPPCDPRIGVPGGVYTCPLPNFQRSETLDCTWWDVDPSTDNCVSWEYESDRPSSIGPDAGGMCALFDDLGCKGKLVRTFKCPGVTDTQGVGYFKSLQCLKVPGT